MFQVRKILRICTTEVSRYGYQWSRVIANQRMVNQNGMFETGLEERGSAVIEPAAPARRRRKRSGPPLPRQPTFDRPDDGAGEVQPTRKRVTKRAARKNGKAGLTPRVRSVG